MRTLGRVTPVLMTLTVVLSVSYAFVMNVHSEARMLYWASAASFTLALISTIIFNVPINLATGRWDASKPPDDWKATRNRWEFFQGVRSWLLLIGFVLVCAAVAS